jgi:hypothetical protein
MTFLGGIGHTLPYLIPTFGSRPSFLRRGCDRARRDSYIRFRYMDTSFLTAAFQVVIGGALVFLAGILIGSS